MIPNLSDMCSDHEFDGREDMFDHIVLIRRRPRVSSVAPFSAAFGIIRWRRGV